MESLRALSDPNKMKGMSTSGKLISTAFMLVVITVFSSTLDNLSNNFQRYRYIVFNWVWKLLQCNDYYRYVTYEQKIDKWGYSIHGEDDRNHILQKALTLYISKMQDSMDMEDANVSLVQIAQKAKKNSSGYWSSDDDEDAGNVASELKKFEVANVPPKDIWIKLQKSPKELWLKKERYVSKPKSSGNSGESSSGPKVTTVVDTFIMRSNATNAKEVVNEYVNKAYEWYTKTVEDKQDHSRYMYSPLPNSGGADGPMKWKRYALSDEKTFDSVFFPQKKALLHLLNHFKNKSGKFAIDGYPHKLGLLLHGPPGTGKTSLVKALAHHTDRNIVNIPLSRIRTNQELMDCVFDQIFQVPAENDLGPIRLDYSKTIFIMEDVDAASTVVHKRESAKVDEKEEQERGLPSLRDSLPAVEGVGEGDGGQAGQQEGAEGENGDAKAGGGSKIDRLKTAVKVVLAVNRFKNTDNSEYKDSIEAPELTRQGSKYSSANEAEDGDEGTQKTEDVDVDLTAPVLTRQGSKMSSRQDSEKDRDKESGKEEEGKKSQENGDTKDKGKEGQEQKKGENKNEEKEKEKDAETAGEKKGKKNKKSKKTKKGSDKDNGGDEDDGDDGDGDKDKDDDDKDDKKDDDDDGDDGDDGDDDDDDDDGKKTKKKKKKKKNSGGATGSSQSKKDTLDLAGLLNVLDGVVDCPDRIVVMTTNHPEKLDPALIRPGRINWKILMGYVELPEAKLMVQHYFGGYRGRMLTEQEHAGLEQLWGMMKSCSPPLILTPALLEQFCAEYDSVDELIQGIKTKL